MKKLVIIFLLLSSTVSLARDIDCQTYYGKSTANWTNCYGSAVWPNGDTYVGQWLNGMRHGQGRFVYSNSFFNRLRGVAGEMYYGEWRRDKRSGQGIWTDDQLKKPKHSKTVSQKLAEKRNQPKNRKEEAERIKKEEEERIAFVKEWEKEQKKREEARINAEKKQQEEERIASLKREEERIAKLKREEERIAALPECGGDSPYESFWNGCQKTYTYPDGKTYSGEFIKGKPIGNYKFCIPYKCVAGVWNKFRKGMVTGNVTIFWWHKPLGEWKSWKAKVLSLAAYTYNQNNTYKKYVGEVNNVISGMPKPHGQGTLMVNESSYDRAIDGDKYIGEWKSGFIVKGTRISANGDEYIGEFNKKSQAHGKGVLTLTDGRVFKGTFENNEFVNEKERIAAKKKRDEERKSAEKKREQAVNSGTGFAVSDLGYVVTNHHVIEGCNNVYIMHQGEKITTKIISNDFTNDIALLKGQFEPTEIFSLSKRNAGLHQDIYVAGYPFGNFISSTVKVTKGIVSSLSGFNNNFSQIQIDAAIQPGNSGGPIYNDKGNVIGVARGTMCRSSKCIEEFGITPENMSFGIKSNVVINFLESNGIKLKDPNNETISAEQLGKTVTEATYFLSCWMTAAQKKKYRSQKVMFEEYSE